VLIVSDKGAVRVDEDPEDRKKRKLVFRLDKVEVLDNLDTCVRTLA
jgi:ribosome-associated protein YbcJ (S4-like RNA binding protein)